MKKKGRPKGGTVTQKQRTALERNRSGASYIKGASVPNPLKSAKLKDDKDWEKEFTADEMSQEKLRELVPSLNKKVE